MYKPDLSKIRDAGLIGNKFGKWLKQNKIKNRNVFQVDFTDNKKYIHYIGASHYPNNNLQKLLTNIYSNNLVDITIVEGVSYSSGMNFDRQINTNITKQDEVDANIFNARKYNIPYVGLEPDDKIMFQYVLKNGYSKSDILLFVSLWDFSHFNGTSTEFNTWINQATTHANKILKVKSFDFYKHYEKIIWTQI